MSAEAPQVDVAAASVAAEADAPPAETKPKCKPCCACPETRKPRDECIGEKGEEACGDLIEAHRQCMLSMGFRV